ncbi:MAG TPA: DUF6328 family protein [Actinomycetota bacterium]|nr:DUF6328 family protein [Actinomycetota bacterium]
MSDQNEEEKERLNRKLIELLNELRVALPGVQVLFAFLLILPFNTGFERTTAVQRGIYAAALIGASAASALLIGPAAYHRHRFYRLEEETVDEKKEMLVAQDHLAAGGIFLLAIAMLTSVFLVLDVLFGATKAWIAAIVLGLVFGWFWYVLPMTRRIRSRR